MKSFCSSCVCGISFALCWQWWRKKWKMAKVIESSQSRLGNPRDVSRLTSIGLLLKSTEIDHGMSRRSANTFELLCDNKNPHPPSLISRSGFRESQYWRTSGSKSNSNSTSGDWLLETSYQVGVLSTYTKTCWQKLALNRRRQFAHSKF